MTHGFDMNQRYQALSFTPERRTDGAGAGQPNLTPPGHYMLFILNANNVPSKARIMRLR